MLFVILRNSRLLIWPIDCNLHYSWVLLYASQKKFSKKWIFSIREKIQNKYKVLERVCISLSHISCLIFISFLKMEKQWNFSTFLNFIFLFSCPLLPWFLCPWWLNPECKVFASTVLICEQWNGYKFGSIIEFRYYRLKPTFVLKLRLLGNNKWNINQHHQVLGILGKIPFSLHKNWLLKTKQNRN